MRFTIAILILIIYKTVSDNLGLDIRLDIFDLVILSLAITIAFLQDIKELIN